MDEDVYPDSVYPEPILTPEEKRRRVNTLACKAVALETDEGRMLEGCKHEAKEILEALGLILDANIGPLDREAITDDDPRHGTELGAAKVLPPDSLVSDPAAKVRPSRGLAVRETFNRSAVPEGLRSYDPAAAERACKASEDAVRHPSTGKPSEGLSDDLEGLAAS